MIQLLVILVSLVAISIEFFSITWGWIVLALPIAFILITLVSVKSRKWKETPELSAQANEMLQKYGHYYSMPFGARDFSASASTLMFAGAIIAIIGAFKGFWWGIGIGVINWIILGIVSKAFDPTNFISDLSEKTAHEEVISYIMERKGN